MFIYTQFSLRLLGGSAKVAENLSSSKCPLGTPPLCCLPLNFCTLSLILGYLSPNMLQVGQILSVVWPFPANVVKELGLKVDIHVHRISNNCLL